MKYFKKLKNVRFKENAGLVSEADRESEATIMKAVLKAYPTHKFLGEETGLSAPKDDVAPMWIVDPLDGTTNYVHGFPFFCVSIGLEVEGKIEVAVIHAPLLKYTFTARRGRGAYLNGTKIRVSGTKSLQDGLLATGFSYKKGELLDAELEDFKHLAERSLGIRRAGSAALDLCMVAWGVFDGFWERELAPWDTAAGSLLVAEAGGRVTSFQGETFHCRMNSILAGNPYIYPVIQKVLCDPV